MAISEETEKRLLVLNQLALRTIEIETLLREFTTDQQAAFCVQEIKAEILNVIGNIL